MESKFSHEQSLALISEMIEQARNNFQKGAGNSFILYGYAVAVIALLNVLLAFALPNPNQSFLVWCLMFLVGIIDRMLDKKTARQTLAKTHIDKIISMTWRAFAIAVVLFLVVIFGYGILMKNPEIFILITPILLLMAGTAEFVTAIACRFKSLMTGACILWVGAIACLSTWNGYSTLVNFGILAICMILAFTVPGYKLNKMAEENV